MLEIQRARILAAAAREFDQRGFSNTTIAHLTASARVSRRTFYDLFANREQCLAAILDETVALIEGDLAAAGLHGLAWRERIRGGLAVILAAFDREPVLARVCAVQTLQAGGAVFAGRETILTRLAEVVDEGAREAPARGGGGRVALTAKGVVGAALAIVHGQLARRDPQPLTSLLGELCAMIVLPYLGAAAAKREQARTSPAAAHQAVGSAGGASVLSRSSGEAGGDRDGSAASMTTDPLGDVPMRLTYRTVRVLEGVRDCPGANNRQIADRAGIHDPGQVSRLLARLQRLGLVTNQGDGAHSRGEANAWALTAKGRNVTDNIRQPDSSRKQIE